MQKNYSKYSLHTYIYFENFHLLITLTHCFGWTNIICYVIIVQKGVIAMKFDHKNISRFIAAAAVSAICFSLSVFSSAAADAPESSESSKLPVIALAAIFAVAMISSSVITYKLRTRKINQQKIENNNSEEK